MAITKKVFYTYSDAFDLKVLKDNNGELTLYSDMEDFGFDNEDIVQVEVNVVKLGRIKKVFEGK
jgi:uncharacterized protein YkuJ